MNLIETKQLFTELTTEESAAVNGGYWVYYFAYDSYYGYRYLARYWADDVVATQIPGTFP